ncbi:MAG: lysylphosphatidylglycerol synthase domain-containing protein [Anaerolineae bacterium]
MGLPKSACESVGSAHSPILRKLRAWATIPLLRFAFLAVALVFMLLVLHNQWDAVQHYRLTLRLWLLLASYALLFLAWLLEVSLWRRLLLALGHALPPKRAASVWFLSNFVRYIPGNIWQFLGMTELGAHSGLPRTVTLATILLHQVFSNLAGLTIGAYAISYSSIPKNSPYLPVAALLLAILLLLSPAVFPRIVLIVSKFARVELPRINLHLATIIALFAAYCLYWLLCGVGFWLLSLAVGAALAPPLLPWVSAFAAAYVVGYLSLLTPSGLGVRESVLALLLARFAGGNPVIVAALAARIWMSLGELVATIVTAMADRHLLLHIKGR